MSILCALKYSSHICKQKAGRIFIIILHLQIVTKNIIKRKNTQNVHLNCEKHKSTDLIDFNFFRSLQLTRSFNCLLRKAFFSLRGHLPFLVCILQMLIARLMRYFV